MYGKIMKRTVALALLLFLGAFASISAQDAANPVGEGGLTVPTPEAAPVSPVAPGVSTPTTTGIPGGYHITFPTLTPIGGLAIRGELAGDYQVHLDTPVETLDVPPQPVSDVSILIPLADYWIFRGKGERAIPLYERGLANDPKNLLLQNNLAMLYSSVSEDQDKAIALIDSALEERPDHVTLLDTKALILLNAGRAFESIPLLERAVELSCQGPLYVLHLAYALDMVGAEDRSRDWFERVRPVIEASPNKMLKENQDMFDALQIKYGAAF